MNKNFKYTILSFVSLLMFSNEISAKTAPSFDCAKATTEVEKLICSDDELAKLDVEMNKWYKKARLWRAICLLKQYYKCYLQFFSYPYSKLAQLAVNFFTDTFFEL